MPASAIASPLTPTEASARARDLCRLAPVIPVLVIDDLAHAEPLARALVAGGLPVLEVTLRTPVALAAIRAMATVPGGVVGAGTLLTPADVAAAVAHGARFGVSPGSTDRLLDAYGTRGAVGRDQQISARIVSDELSQLKVMGTVLPSIFLLVSMFILNVVVSRQVATQRSQIAALKALGYDDSAIVWHYLGLAMAKSVVFGAFIALIGCHWGLRVKPNTQSLGEGTTASVVSSITMVIIVDALFAVAFKNIGI